MNPDRRHDLFEITAIILLFTIIVWCSRIHSRLEEINMDVLSISTERLQ